VSLSAAAAAMGLPEDLVQRSAEARAAETGASVDEILAAWAGGEAAAPAIGESVAATTETETPPAEPAAAQEPETPEPEPAAPTSVMAAAPQPTQASSAPTRAPIPEEVTLTEAAQLPEVITVPTAGIRERTNFVMPKWLTGLMVIVPLFALFALGGSSTGACGEATELATNIISGEIVNCDGSQFTGGGVGGGGVDYISAGQDIFMGVAVTGVNCSGCHGVNGQGSDTFPALTGVLTTFGSCTDHKEWVTLGSSGWSSTNGSTYGDTQKPVNGGMPTFGGTLTEEQIASVATFERVRFGGEDPETALVDCGLAESPDASGGAATDGGAAGSTTTTTPAG
jgi:mono/diheme cytochrome c family protein